MNNPNKFDQFKEFVLNSSIPHEVKRYLMNDAYLRNCPEFYFSYASAFADAFKIKDTVTLQKLDNIGFLYYFATLLFDTTVDDKAASNTQSKFIIRICQDEVVRQLSSIFDNQSKFWELWAKRTAEFFNAILIEEKLHEKATLKHYCPIKIKAGFPFEISRFIVI